MSAADSLDLVINLATERRDHAIRMMNDARRYADAARAKLSLLQRYRDDSEGTSTRQLESALTDPIRMANSRAFIDKLDIAIQQQRGEVTSADTRTADATKAMQGAETRLKALGRLREHRMEEERRVENRREQAGTDAFAARAARNGGGSLLRNPV